MAEPPAPSAPDVPGRKRVLRGWARRVRDGMDPRERRAAGEAIESAVLALKAWRRASLVLTYLSFGSEVETRGLVRAAWAAGKRVAAPRCVTRELPGGVEPALAWVEIRSLEGLAPGAFGIEEPPAACPTLGEEDVLAPDAVALVPGLAFDRAGMRLGYGGGYYDRFLRSFPGTSVGLCPDALLVRSLAEAGATDEHDLPVDVVVSERGARWPQRGGAA